MLYTVKKTLLACCFHIKTDGAGALWIQRAQSYVRGQTIHLEISQHLGSCWPKEEQHDELKVAVDRIEASWHQQTHMPSTAL